MAKASNGRFNGKTVLLAGAARGVGLATMEKLIAEEATLFACDINPLVAEEAGVRGVPHATGDLSVSHDVAGIFEACRREIGAPEVIISTVGQVIAKPIDTTSDAEFDQMIGANAKSLFLLVREGLADMRRMGCGAIVATGSISSMLGLQGQTAYAAGKGALAQLVRQLCVDLAPENIRINAVCPGSVATPMLENYLAEQEDRESAENAIRRAHPMGRWAEPSEIANALVYLASDEASFVNGALLMVDGGYSAQ
jgi:dihydroanticapsin dehydrogenase